MTRRLTDRRRRRLDLLLAAALFVVALAARLWHLGDVPAVFFHDECDNTVNAIQILSGQGPGLFGLDWKPQPALAVHLIAISVRALGPAVIAVRLPSALLSALAVSMLFMVARLRVGPWPAAAAALLLGCHHGFLHLSRSGWENVQICWWTLVALLAVQRGVEGHHRGWYLVAGSAAVIAGLTYFAGWLVVVVVFAWLGSEALRTRSRRRQVTIGLALAALAATSLSAPLVKTLVIAGPPAFRRVATVSIGHFDRGGGTSGPAAEALDNLAIALRATWDPDANHQPRYTPPGRPLFDLTTFLLAAIGGVSSIRRRREGMALWWLALAVPFIITQGLAVGAPNLGRGIGALAIVYLFVALGIETVVGAAGRDRLVTRVVVAGLVLISAASGALTYARWASGLQLTKALQPAITMAEVASWWSFQRDWVASGREFCDLRTWLEEHRVGPRAQ